MSMSEELSAVYAARDRMDDRYVESVAKYRTLANVVYEQCSREGCHCPGEIKGECAFCILSAALNGFTPSGGEKL